MDQSTNPLINHVSCKRIRGAWWQRLRWVFSM